MTRRAEVRRHHGRPCLFVDGEHLPLVAYSPVRGERRELFRRQVERFARHGMHAYLVTPPRALVDGDWSANPFWVGDEVHPEPVLPCSNDLDEDVGWILDHDPEALVLVRFGPNEPASWRALHPDELSRDAAGVVVEAPSLASERHQAMVERYSRAVVAWMEDRPWAERILGYWNGDRHEGSHQLAMAGRLVDHAPVMLARWRSFLRARYGSDDTLRMAHGTTAYSLDDAPLPADPFVDGDAGGPHWRAGPAARALGDYLELLAGCYAGYLRRLAAATRAGCGGRERVLLVDALKQPMQGWTNRGFFDPGYDRPADWADILAGSGHLGVAGLIADSGWDGFITPHDYQARGLGGIYEPEGAADSAVLRGRLFLCEMDTRTRHGSDPIAPARDQRAFEAITWRNLATGWTRGFHSYWMDVHQDWFADDAIHATIERQVAVTREVLELPHEPVPGIALVIDDRSQRDSTGGGRYLEEAIQWERRGGLARCGVPVRTYLLDDLDHPDFPPHRVYWFPNLLRGDARARELVARRCLRDGQVVVWGPGSGIAGADGVSAAAASALTGFDFELLPIDDLRRVLVTDHDHPITAGVPGGTVYGGPPAYGPLLLPRDGRRLGEAWVRQGRDAGGLVVREHGAGPGRGRGADDYGCVFSVALGLPAGLWRGIARWAGAHVYLEDGDHVVASRRIMALHATASGPRTIVLPERCRVHDLVHDRPVTADSDRIAATVEGPQTLVYRLDPLTDRP